MDNLIKKIEDKLVELGIVVKMADEVTGTTGQTSGATSAAPSVVVSEIIPATIKISYSAIGAPVFAVDAEGKEEAVPDGEYSLVTNKKIFIENGKLMKEEDIVDEEDDKEEMSGETEMSTQKTELAEFPWDECMDKMVKEYGDEETAKKVCGAIKAKGTSMSSDQYMEAIELAQTIERMRLADLIDFTKNGNYSIELSVSDGVVTYGTLYTNTYQNLLMEEEEKASAKLNELTEAYETKMAEEKAKYENIIEALKTGNGEVINKPSENENVTLSKSELLKKNILAKKKS